MIKNEFTFLSSNGKTNIHAITCLPKDNKFTKLFQIVHGMFEYIERYINFIEYLTTKGFLVVGHDLIGHGQSINNKDDLGFLGEPEPDDLLLKDIHTLRIMTQKKYKNIPYFICGHSFGSFLVREYIALYGEGIDGAILLGTGYASPCESLLAISILKVFSCFYGARHRSKFIKKLSMESGPYKKYDMHKKDLNNSWITRDPEIVKEYNEDKKVDFEFTLNGFLGVLLSIQKCCNPTIVAKVRKDLPILFVSGECDPVGNNGDGVKKSYELMKTVGSIDVTMKIYENDRHEVLNELNRNEVYEYIYSWLEEKALLFNKNNKNI